MRRRQSASRVSSRPRSSSPHRQVSRQTGWWWSGSAREREKRLFDWPALGATIAAATAGHDALLLAEFPGCDAGDRAIADLALGARLRSYRFDHYKSKKKKNDDDEEKKGGKLTLASDDPQALKKAAKLSAGLADGVMLARDLVNEPANTLGPVEFAERAAALEKAWCRGRNSR